MATSQIYTLSLHDALPISLRLGRILAELVPREPEVHALVALMEIQASRRGRAPPAPSRSEEHTSELQSRFDLVCRLLLEKERINCELAARSTTGECGEVVG